MVWLEWTLSWHAQILGLVGAQLGQLDVQMAQVRSGHFFVQLLWQNVDADLVLASLGPELDLSQDLIGERVAHDERWMSVSAAQVDQSALGQHDQVLAVLELVAVNLWLDVDLLHTVVIEPLDVQLVVKVANVAQDGVVVHGLKVSWPDDTLATGGGDKDAASWSSLFHGGHLKAFHGSLESVDRVDLGDDDSGAE